ncbi:MAG: hypothetical protein N3B01_12285 [Verrucomicrobiae bacterium]|nr:hypothetical protein [Verrucomicrobiae bacterium]
MSHLEPACAVGSRLPRLTKIKPAPVLSAVFLLLAAGRIVATDPARPFLGAIRWDAWHWAPTNDLTAPVRAVERALGPKRYHHRLPFFAKIVSDERVCIAGYTPAIIAQEIAFAKEAGLDYWAFVLYDTASPMSQALALYLESPERDSIHFCAIADPSIVQQQSRRIVQLMAKPNYLKVAGCRPLLFAFRFKPTQSDLLKQVRSASVEAGCANPYIVAMNDTVQEALGVAEADAISAYAIVGDGGKHGTPYAELARSARSFWQQAHKAGARLVPLAMSGWDRRPRVEHPVPWEPWQKPGIGLDRYYRMPTPSELAEHIQQAVDWVDAHPEQCPARVVLIYAWNEHDEGGWLCPTIGRDGNPDTSRLDAIRNTLELRRQTRLHRTHHKEDRP